MVPFYFGKLFGQTRASDDLCAKLGIDRKKAVNITSAVQRYGNLIGFVERFSIGVRNPTAFLAGSLGIPAECFFAGVCCGGLITLPVQDSNSSEMNDGCGYQGLLEIECRDNDGRAFTNISDHLYYVQSIDYDGESINLIDVDVYGQDCPHPKRNFSLESAPSLRFNYDYGNYDYGNWTLFYNCSSSSRYGDDDDIYVDYRIPCLDYYYKNNTNSTTTTTTTLPPLRSYAFNNDYDIGSIPNWYDRCEETLVTPLSSSSDNFNYTKSAKFGFNLVWSVPIDYQKCEDSGGLCYYDNTTEGYRCSCAAGMGYDGLSCGHDMTTAGMITAGMPTGRRKVIIGVSTGVGGLLLLLLILLLIYRKTFYILYYSAISRWKKKIKKPTNVEEFLESYGVAIQRYSYSEIKKMTNSFKNTLGQGGYGSVFQGKLNRDGRLVAVKVLNESKGNGEDFINEVATIGRTNHVNVVSLLGYCTEGTKRALVYEFMPNGSLERFIYNDKMSTSNATTTLGWDKRYQITLGIVRGLEYLHCRCNTRILHFDIKPHNILLDQDFCPKISDFGLAKLCPTKESIVSMVGARGTMGYIAPEISCRNLGGVSHKSDVYSYGMMVLEMIGGRKNLDVTVENISGIYFPHWIYNQLKQDSKVEGPEIMKLEGVGEILKDPTAKKMIMVALWCIQTHPANRPSMTKVVEMLEGSNEELQMPPNPSLDPLSLSSFSSS
ncbi:hypothetical protein AQUCO_03400143v1 [Aquilegia coerulea]|uniref:non-specific serine/threonine protein kinase n=2 Tax=Aquilegia coerulea TaxID=218851 RepID=A0A2G5CXP8_AQUCA|nr:hypothetical protein AQUCO_03400143v1 [Aquilegia coerulea]